MTLAHSNIAPMSEGRGLAAHRALAVDKLPDDTLLDEESPTGFGDADSRVALGEAVAGDIVEQPLPFLAIDRLGGEARWQRGDLVPIIFEGCLRGVVGIDEARIRVGVVGEHGVACLRIEPLG